MSSMTKVSCDYLLTRQRENSSLMLDKLNYKDNHWQVCGDLKIISIILGKQGVLMILYLWENRDRQYRRKDVVWNLEQKKVIHETLIEPSKLLTGLMKQFVKTLQTKYVLFISAASFHDYQQQNSEEGIFTGYQKTYKWQEIW